MNVLLINQYYPPDASATAGVFADIVSSLRAAGHSVTVLAGRPSYDPPSRTRWRLFAREASTGLVVERVGSAAFDRRRMWGRAINYLSFLPLAALRAVAMPADVVLVGSDPPLAVAAALAAARGRPVVYSLRDLHPEFTVASRMMRDGRVTRAWACLHRAALRGCARVICLGEGMAERAVAAGAHSDRVVVVPDGAWAPASTPDATVVAELRAGAEFVVVHAGNLGGAVAWETIAGAARLLDGACRLLFVGDGCRAQSLRSAGVDVVPFRPPEQLPSVMAAGDLQVVSLRRSMEGLVVPSKLFAILAHGRPVLAVVPERSEAARIVREHRCGLVANPQDAESVAAAVRWARAHPEELRAMGRRAALAARLFERGPLLERFVRLIEETAGVPAQARTCPPYATPSARAGVSSTRPPRRVEVARPLSPPADPAPSPAGTRAEMPSAIDAHQRR